MNSMNSLLYSPYSGKLFQLFNHFEQASNDVPPSSSTSLLVSPTAITASLKHHYTFQYKCKFVHK